MTNDELRGRITALQIAKQSKEVQLWITETKKLKDLLLASNYMAKGEESIRVLGVQQGMDISMHIDDVLTAQGNLGNKGIIKP